MANRARLARLLGVRVKLTQLVAERQSLRIDDHTDIWLEQLAAEAEIYCDLCRLS